MNALITPLLLAAALTASGFASAATGTVYACRDTNGNEVFSNAPCEARVQLAVVALSAGNGQSDELERVDRDMGAVRSAIATRRVERKEALNKVHRRKGVPQEEIDAQAEVVKQIYQRKINELSDELARLGVRRNALMERSAEEYLEVRAH